MSDLSKSVHANSNFNIQNVNISQVPIILHSCRPTLLTINLISVPPWDFMYCPLNLQLYIIFLSGFTNLMFLFLLIRNLHLGPLRSSKFHTSIGCSATFSVTREIWGKTDAEIEEEKGIPEPPREVTLYNITRAIKFNGLIFSTGSVAEAKFSFGKDNNMMVMFHGQNNLSDSNLSKINLLKKTENTTFLFTNALQENIQGNSSAA